MATPFHQEDEEAIPQEDEEAIPQELPVTPSQQAPQSPPPATPPQPPQSPRSAPDAPQRPRGRIIGERGGHAAQAIPRRPHLRRVDHRQAGFKRRRLSRRAKEVYMTAFRARMEYVGSTLAIVAPIYYRYLQAQQAGDQDQVNELRDRIYLSVIHLSAQDLNMAIARYGYNSYASCIVQGIHLLVLDINQQMAHLAHVTSLVQG